MPKNFIVELRPDAINDIEKATDYYHNINPDLAIAFLFRIEETKKDILNAVEGFEVKYKNIRTILLKQFPYHLHYIVENKNKKVIILSVLHAHINPDKYRL